MIHTRKKLAALLLAAAASASLAGVAGAHEPGPRAQGGDSSSHAAVHSQLAQVRRATAKFHNVAVAEAAGYINPGPGHCIAVPGLGGMGVHFVNPGLVFDGKLDITKPEVLLYVESGNGWRLVGVEYLQPMRGWTGDHPSLFGTRFDGPMPEHEPNTTGDHWDLHVWTWSNNPAGRFATWNPAISC